MKLNVGDCNNAGPVSTDFVGGNYDWPEADYPTREKIFQAHVTYQQGLMWFLAHDERLPERIREKAKQFGLPKNEFAETGGWPHDLYVREARRLLSDYVMTEKNCLGKEVAEDSVGLASYTMDSHNVQRVIVNGAVRGRGERRVEGAASLPGELPQPGSEGEGVRQSARAGLRQQFAHGLWVDPDGTGLHDPGPNAATAASLAIDAGVAVQAVPYDKLKERLLADRQKLAGLKQKGRKRQIARE